MSNEAVYIYMDLFSNTEGRVEDTTFFSCWCLVREHVNLYLI
jgi:hypothetical protein